MRSASVARNTAPSSICHRSHGPANYISPAWHVAISQGWQSESTGWSVRRACSRLYSVAGYRESPRRTLVQGWILGQLPVRHAPVPFDDYRKARAAPQWHEHGGNTLRVNTSPSFDVRVPGVRRRRLVHGAALGRHAGPSRVGAYGMARSSRGKVILVSVLTQR